MYCKNCGKELADGAVFCPYCGVATDNFGNAVKAETRTEERGETNVLAIVGFILSFFIALAGLICSIIGYQNAPRYNGKGKKLAIAGIVISAVWMALVIIIYAGVIATL